MSSDTSSSGTRGNRPYFDGPNTPAHQEFHHTPYHSTRGSPAWLLVDSPHTPPPYSPTPFGSIKGGVVSGSGEEAFRGTTPACAGARNPPREHHPPRFSYRPHLSQSKETRFCVIVGLSDCRIFGLSGCRIVGLSDTRVVGVCPPSVPHTPLPQPHA